MRLIYAVLFYANLAASFAWFMASLWGGDGALLLPSLGHLCLAALLFFPHIVRKEIQVFDPLNLVILYVVIGGLAPCYAILFESSVRIDFLMANRPVGDFIDGAFLYAVSMLLVGLGYAGCQRRLRLERFMPREDRLSAKGFQFAIAFGAIISCLAIALFVQSTGGLTASIEGISRKRAIEVISNGEVVYASAGYLRMAGDITLPIMLIVLSYYLSRYKHVPRLFKVQLWGLGLLAVTIPFISSSRTEVIFVVIAILIVLASHNRMSRKLVIMSSVILLLVFGAMSTLRGAAQGGLADRFESPFKILAESGNGLSLIGTTHVIKGVPERMPYQWGATYLTWLTAPIPRSVWAGKPDVSLGKRIKGEILRQNVIRTGRPPSIINEGWINFGLPGFLISALGFGYVLRLVSNSFYPLLRRYAFAAPVFCSIALNTANMVNSAFSQGVVRVLTDVVLITACYMLIQYSFSRKTAQVPLAGKPTV